MDIKRIGEFIASLRRDKEMTQMELGEKLGVTNKTISRWENGNYMPSIEMLQMLSKEFDVSINEILCGERIIDDNYKEKAEETIVRIIKSSTFTIKEKQDFWRKKWLKDNISSIIIDLLVVIGVFIYGFINKDSLYIVGSVSLATVINIVLRNKMMGYIEKNTFE